MDSFRFNLEANRRTTNTVFHASLNPSPADKQTDEGLRDIAREYLHIVSLRGGENGRKIRNPHDYDRSMSVLQELKRKYNLHPSVKGQELTDTPGLRKVNYKAGNVKQQISSVVQSCLRNYKCSSHGELRTLLEQFNVSAEEHRRRAKLCRNRRQRFTAGQGVHDQCLRHIASGAEKSA